MKKNIITLILLMFIATPMFAGDFISDFLKKCVEEKRPVSNINIGKKMLEKLFQTTDDEDLKNAIRDLKSIRLITSEKRNDSKIYFQKAHELIKSDFDDYKELVSVNDRNTKMSILMKQIDSKTQDVIMVGLDEDEKLTIINVTGKVNFKTFSKLSESLSAAKNKNEDTD